MRQSRTAVFGAARAEQGTDRGGVAIEPLETLIGVHESNRRLLRLLERTGADLGRARAYLAGADANLALGIARVGQLRERRRKVLRQLEANWRLVQELGAVSMAG
jgi:hypothetical protein